jgi:hypothetical protein
MALTLSFLVYQTYVRICTTDESRQRIDELPWMRCLVKPFMYIFVSLFIKLCSCRHHSSGLERCLSIDAGSGSRSLTFIQTGIDKGSTLSEALGQSIPACPILHQNRRSSSTSLMLSA